jgi:hypothetical protein
VLSISVLVPLTGTPIMLSSRWRGERLAAGVLVTAFVALFAAAVDHSLRRQREP